jgi:hypothetical protein
MNAALQAALAHAMDPQHTAAPPLIPLPPSSSQTLAMSARALRDRRRPWWIAAGALLVIALCGTAMTASAALTGWPFSLERATAASAAGSPLQLTEMARTIEQLSTQVAASGLKEEDLQQAVAQTLTAMQAGSPGALPVEASLSGPGVLLATPTPTHIGLPTSPALTTANGQGTQSSTSRSATPTNPPATGVASTPTPGSSAAPPPATSAPPATAQPPTSAPPTSPPPTSPPPTSPPPTSPPAATKTPKPKSCHGHSCTPTPGP